MSPLYQALGAGRIPQMSDFCCILQLQGGASCVVGLFEGLCKPTQENLTPDCPVPNAAGRGSVGVLSRPRTNVCSRSASTNAHIYPSLLQAVPGRGVAGRAAADFGGIGGRICRILQVNFRELLFHALG